MSPQVKQEVEMWGEYEFKPVAQIAWDNLVAVATAEIIKIDEFEAIKTIDVRPRLYDLHSKSWLLLDTGAACSVYPKSLFPTAQLDTKKALKAVNGTTINTYGNETVTIRTNHRSFQHKVVVADVESPLLGWDFLVNFRLDLRWDRRQSQCHLHDPRGRPIPLTTCRRDVEKLHEVEKMHAKVNSF